MDIVCEYCRSSFSSKSNLKKHIAASKYCSDLRGDEFVAKHTCEDCGREFTARSSMQKHRLGCGAVVEKEMDILKMRIANLEAIVAEKNATNAKLKKKLKASTAQTVPKKRNRFSSIITDTKFFCTTDHVIEELNKGKFSMEDGVVGLVDFISLFIKKGDARCYVRTDKTRQTFYRYTTDGRWAKDSHCKFFGEILTLMIPFVDDWWIEYQKTFKETGIENALNKYHRVIYGMHHGIIHPSSDERDVLIREIVGKTSPITHI